MVRNDEYIKPDKLITLSESETMDIETLSKCINKHGELITNRYKILKDAYIGNHPILHQADKESYKPDNRIVVNFAKYIVDIMNGFFIGIPIKVTSEDEDVHEYINLLDKYNDQDDNNAELSKICSIYGKGYEIYWVDSTGNISITYLNPFEGFMVYDDTILQRPRYFVTYYRDSKNVLHGQVMDSEYIYEFDDDGGLHFLEEPKQHGFTDIPATEYIENEERTSIFEPVYSMINAYNKAISEKANDVDYFADAYLKILGAKLEEDTLKNIRDDRIINLEGDYSNGVIVEFMNKPNADATQENLINRLDKLIFQNSMVANLNDDTFGERTGIALKYKLLSMENLAKAKERKFTSGLNRRYRVIFSNATHRMHEDDWMKVDYKFSQNYPANILEEAQISRELSGVVSHETQLSVLSIVEDVKQELEKIDDETKDDEIMNQYFGTLETVTNGG